LTIIKGCGERLFEGIGTIKRLVALLDCGEFISLPKG